MPEKQTSVKIFADTSTGWLPVGCARVETIDGRQVLRISLDAMPTNGRLCLPLADVGALMADEVAGHA